VYLLHGYGADGSNPVVNSRRGLRRNYPLIVRLPFRRFLAGIVTYEKLDKLIRDAELPPFILVQPDGSLHLANIFGAKGLDGEVGTKGSLYTDSPSSGKFATYVFDEIVRYVDKSYRSFPEQSGRSLIGGSMGGYGALLGGILHPDRFQAVVALSPSICCLDLLEIQLVVPFNRILFGQTRAKEIGRQELGDILDTCDLVFSNDHRLLPSIERDEGGRTVRMDPEARANWARSDLNWILEHNPGGLAGVALQINCAESDEFGFAEPCRRFHAQLLARGIEHEFEIYPGGKMDRVSPHILGIAAHVLPALSFCLNRNRS
jgi:hypothetical protein